jgi:sporulation protein YlmC with PRC-barrel domain
LIGLSYYAIRLHSSKGDPRVTTNISSQTLDATLSLSAMLKDAIIDANGKPLGRLRDVVVKLRRNQYPLFSGLVIGVGSARGFVPGSDVLSMDAKSIQLRTGRVSLLPFERSDGEVLLKQDILGH